MINYQFYPRTKKIPQHLENVVEIFQKCESVITSDKFEYNSNDVLHKVRGHLEEVGFQIEKSKTASDKISVPVLFGRNGKYDKYFDADGYNENTRTVIEVEAGRAYANNQFLKDLFQACVMNDIDYLIIAVRNKYRKCPDFERIDLYLETLFSSDRLRLPLKGVLLIGY